MSLQARFLAASFGAALLAWLVFICLPRERLTLARTSTEDRAERVASTATATPRPELPPTSSLQTTMPPPTTDEAPLRPPPIALDAAPLAWELQLADASHRRNRTDQARALFALLASLPEDALATAAQQAVEHLPDSDYTTIALPVLTDPKTHGQVLSVLFADLSERPDAIALPALLTIARNPAHPFSSAALDDLRLLLRANFSTDWPRWEQAVQQALTRSNPRTPASDP